TRPIFDSRFEVEEREELKSLLRQVVQDENKSGAKEIYNDVDVIFITKQENCRPYRVHRRKPREIHRGLRENKNYKKKI
ncbi:hypothetical protein HRED_06962, partial [Candidatus Haloredivivus sp. G17]